MFKGKGYIVPNGYMGWIENESRYQLFETESAYYNYLLTEVGV